MIKVAVFTAVILSLSFCKTYASDCETARANASSAVELIAKAEAAGFKLDANAKARITACFKNTKRKHRP